MTKWITITVPCSTEPCGFKYDSGGTCERQSATAVFACRGGVQINVRTRDVVTGIHNAWPTGEPTDRANLPAIQARHDAAGDGRRMDLGDGWQAHDDRGVLLDEIARLRAPATEARTPDDPLYVPATGCEDCGNDPGERHGVDRKPLSLAWLGGTREATIAKLPADIAALVRDDAPLTPSERAELVERASPATRTFLAAVDRLRAGGSSAEGLEALQTYLRATLPAKPSTGLDVALASDEEGMRTLAGVPSAEECAALPQPPPEPDIEPAIGE